MNYNVIGITLGTRCNAKCSICCMNNDIKDELDISTIRKYILSTKHSEKIKGICFTGGEVFLYYNELKELVALVHDCGKKCGVITNGYWGYEYQNAYDLLLELHNKGLRYLTISYDEFHEKYIPAPSISNILKACKLLNIEVNIQSVILKDTNSSGWIRRVGNILEDIRVNFVPCMPVGNAKENIQNSMYIRNNNINGLKCRKAGSFSVTSDGKVWPCCSPNITDTGLIVDNILNNDNVEITLEKLRKNIILHALRNYGFDFFVDIAVNKLHMELPDKYTSSCELCSILFAKENIGRFIMYTRDKLVVNFDSIR